MLDNEAELVHMHMSCIFRYKMGNYYELIIIMQFLKGFHFYILMYLYEC